MEASLSFRSSSFLRLTPTSFSPHFPAKLRLTRLKRSNSAYNYQNHSILVRKACGSEENGSVNGFPALPNKIFMEEAIGAEYGEGFETFRPDGLLKVDVDFLNDRLQEGFLQRIRYAMKPDEAYGLIFSWDNVV
ncbi:uncharacterized protein LOC111386863 isoform X2 [Olea europaea var. sylvestris]|nr:uncharacterized protein LOC111386863 isoform X2 [Olea europaea var. sylvestris]